MRYSNCSGAVRWSGGLTVLTAGASIADDHPLVAERPDLFTDAEPAPDIKHPADNRRDRGGPVVEAATRAPGEQRQNRAPRAAKGKAAAGE